MNYNLDGVTRDHVIEIRGQFGELPTPNSSWSYLGRRSRAWRAPQIIHLGCETLSTWTSRNFEVIEPSNDLARMSSPAIYREQSDLVLLYLESGSSILYLTD